MPIHRTCDGISRRDFVRIGVAGTTGLTLANYLRLAAAGEVRGGKATSAIFINLQGGPSHMDMFDMKPESPTEYRGDFRPIKTNVAGIEISEHLPKLASCVDKYAILRGVTHTLGAHELGTEYVNTGNRPLPSLEYPSYGSVVTKELGGNESLPPFVAIPNSQQKPGFLGVQYSALNTAATPRAGQPFSVRGVSLGNGMTVAEFEKRQGLLGRLDKTFAEIESDSSLLEGLDRFSQQAYAMISSKETRAAFDISQEPESLTKTFGETPFGLSCLLGLRLVASGIRFVTISSGGWDTHLDNWNRLKDRQLPPFDEGLASLLHGLEAKGLLESTVVYVTGEFGRTPKINQQRIGRDHHPRNMFMLMAGGGVRGGQVLGSSDDKGMMPADEGRSPDDVAASFYHALGIDHKIEYQTNTGRPITLVRDGRVIPELFA